MSEAERIPELDVAAMVAGMRPPTDDEVPIALDGTPLDMPAKMIAYLEGSTLRAKSRGAVRPDSLAGFDTASG